jgi:repressor of nif and glnA expression
MSYHLSRLDERALVAREGKGRKARWALTKGGLSLLTAQVDAAI